MGTIHLKLLGQFECKTDAGKAISLHTRKAEALLAYLALEPGIRHPRERLINLLWSDRGEEQAGEQIGVSDGGSKQGVMTFAAGQESSVVVD